MYKKRIVATTALALFITTGSAFAATDHYVKKGDTLWLLAQKYGTSIEAIKRTNNLKTTMIYPGQKLTIPIGQTSSLF